MSGPPQRKLCAFCGGDAAAHGGRLGRMEGPYNASRSSYEAVYVHHDCAVWSPKTSQDEKLRLRSVGTEVRRARNLRCTSCGRSGAALGCRVPSCNRCFHLPCAINTGASFNFELYLMACPEHAALFRHEPSGQAAERGSGPLAHLKLAGKLRHRQPTHLGIAAAEAAPGARGGKVAAKRKRNTMTAAQLGEHIDAAKAAYQCLAEELQAAHDDSEPDEAVILRKDTKRLRKAAKQLAPTLLRPPRPPPPQQQLAAAQAQQHWQPPVGGFANIGGLVDVKRQLKEMVLLPLAHPQLMQQLGIQPPRGILLHGPPGTGKTAIVRALAAECAAVAGWGSSGGSSSNKPVALFARKGTDCLGKYAGDAEMHLRLLFDMAAAASPSIIFLDELDGLVPPRSIRSSSSDQIFASVVSVLLALMDGLKDRGQVLVIGATNRPDAIDPALRRPGRFDREVYFNLPGQQDRSGILAVHTARWSQQPSPELLQQLAATTDGWAGADLQSLTARALLAAVRRSSPQLLAAIDHQQQHAQQQQQQQQRQELQHQALQQQQAAQQQQQPGHTPQATPSPAPASGTPEGASMHGAAQHSTPMQPDPAPAAPEAGPAAGAPAAAAGGFLAALTDFLAEQQQPQQLQPWLQPIAPAALSPLGAGEAAPDTGAPPAAAAAAATAAEGAVAAGDGLGPAAGELVATAGTLACSEAPEGHEHTAATTEQQQQQRRQQAMVQLQLQELQQQEQQQQRLPVIPAIEVLPCDWAAALASAGPPASKREMSSLAGLNPAAALAAPLVPLLLPALARVVLLLHRWLLLGQHSQQLAEAAAAVIGPESAAAAGDDGSNAGAGSTGHSRLEQLLAQLGTVEQQLALDADDSLPAEAAAAAEVAAGTSNLHASRDAVGSSSRQTQLQYVCNSSSSSVLESSRCCCLLLSGHGASGQPELAAAVLQLLGAASAAAVHSLSLPAMLLAGAGDVGRGLVCGVREALARVGSGQLLVLYMPRIELWALQPAKQATHKLQQQQASSSVPMSGAWKHGKSAFGGGGAMDGMISSSSSSNESDSSSDSETDSSSDDDEQLQFDSNNALNNMDASAAVHSQHQARLPRRVLQQASQQQQQRLRLSAAWSVLEQQLAVLHCQQGVLLLATSHLPTEALPQEMQQLFGGGSQQPQQQLLLQPHDSMFAPAADHYSSSSAMVQACCCYSSGDGGGDGTVAAATKAVLSCALDRAAVAAVVRYRQQLAFAGVHGVAAHCGPASDAAAHADSVWLEQAAAPDAYTVPAADTQALEAQQQQQQHQQQPPALLLGQLNAAQQAQAKHLFDQVQQQLQLLGGMLLRDPRIRMAKGKQQQQQRRRHSSSMAAASQQQQALSKLQQALPLAAVCVKAVQGWYCSLDEMQADFKAAADKIRCLHAGCGQRHSRSVAAASALEDVLGAACWKAAQQLRLHEPECLQLLKAAAGAKGAAATQQLRQQQQQQRARQQPSALLAVGQPRQADLPAAVAAPAAAVTSAAVAAASEEGLQQGREQQRQQQLVHDIQQHLRALKVQVTAGATAPQQGDECRSILHSAVQQYCQLVASKMATMA